MTYAILKQLGKLPSVIEEFTILVMGVMRISAHSLTSDVGIGSRSHDLDGEDFRILSSSSSDTGVKEDRVFLVGLGLVTEDGIDDCSVDLILRILS